jgi:hypothetical protein
MVYGIIFLKILFIESINHLKFNEKVECSIEYFLAKITFQTTAAKLGSEILVSTNSSLIVGTHTKLGSFKTFFVSSRYKANLLFVIFELRIFIFLENEICKSFTFSISTLEITTSSLYQILIPSPLFVGSL